MHRLRIEILKFDGCFSSEQVAHYAKVDSSLGPSIFEKLHRASVFMYEVVCAFVIQDLDGLIQRHMRKASVAFLKGVE